MPRIEVVIRVSIAHLLDAVETLPVEPVLRLQGLRDMSTTEVVPPDECKKEGEAEALWVGS